MSVELGVPLRSVRRNVLSSRAVGRSALHVLCGLLSVERIRRTRFETCSELCFAVFAWCWTNTSLHQLWLCQEREKVPHSQRMMQVHDKNLVLYARADWNKGTGPFGEWHQEPLSFCLVMFGVRERDLAGRGMGNPLSC